MSEEQFAEEIAVAREKAERLRVLKLKVGSIGKRGLEDTFTLGEALEEASVLLRGHFSTWVKTECGVEPRTALGFRKTYKVLGGRKAWLIEHGVTPSVAVMIACAQPDGRQRALAAIESGRRLTTSGAKLIVRCERPRRKDAPTRAFASLKETAREFCNTLLVEVEQLVAAAGRHDEADTENLAELGVRARSLHVGLSALGLLPVRDRNIKPHPFAFAVANLAAAETPDAVAAAALALLAVFEDAGTAEPPADAPERNVVVESSALAIKSARSTFRHGLKAFEICAGGGGQAAGLAKAGFVHVGMLERDAEPCKTLRAAFGPEHVIEADLVGYEPVDIGPVDLFAGGVPCTPFSSAGEQKGEHDDADCFPDALRLVKLMKPRAVMLENVMGLLGPKHDIYRASILSDLAKMGYQSEWRAVHCTHFGLAQNRKRAILVAFREPEAMARFRWPTPVGDYADRPYPMIAALDTFLSLRGYEPPVDLQERMNRTSPTVIGGSSKKASPDLGQANVRAVWEGVGVSGKRWGDYSPGHDHVGPILPTNKMIAALQGFPQDWPLKGKKRDVYRQIANAFPPVVAMHLGCAIATALTGTEYSPMSQMSYESMRYSLTPRGTKRQDTPTITDTRARAEITTDRKELPLSLLRKTSSINEPEPNDGDVHDIDYEELFKKFGPWPADMWVHQRLYGRF